MSEAFQEFVKVFKQFNELIAEIKQLELVIEKLTSFKNIKDYLEPYLKHYSEECRFSFDDKIKVSVFRFDISTAEAFVLEREVDGVIMYSNNIILYRYVDSDITLSLSEFLLTLMKNEEFTKLLTEKIKERISAEIERKKNLEKLISFLGV